MEELLYSIVHSTTTSNSTSNDELPFILKPEFIVSVLILVLVFVSCVGLVAYRIITLRRREANYFDSGINSDSVLQVFGIPLKKRRLINGDHLIIPLFSSYYSKSNDE